MVKNVHCQLKHYIIREFDWLIKSLSFKIVLPNGMDFKHKIPFWVVRMLYPFVLQISCNSSFAFFPGKLTYRYFKFLSIHNRNNPGPPTLYKEKEVNIRINYHS